VTEQIAALGSRLVGPTGDELHKSAEALAAYLDATPFASGPLTAGAHYTTLSGRNVYGLITPASGWSKVIEDSEVFALVKGKMTLAFHHAASAIDEASIVSAIGTHDTSGFGLKPTAATIGGYAGLVAQSPARQTLWYTAGLQAFDPNPGDDVRIWIIDIERTKPVTIELTGPPAEIGASLSEIDTLLDSLVAY
jgi:hypothetical protein